MAVFYLAALIEPPLFCKFNKGNLPLPSPTIAHWHDILSCWARSGTRRSTTTQEYEKVLLAFARMHQHKQAPHIVRKDVLAFRDSLLLAGQHSTTVGRKIGILKTLFRCAVDYELMSSNPAEHVRVVRPPRPKPRVAFSSDDLNRIFASPLYTDNKLPKGAGKEAAYWLPLLALFTGARLEELAQLLVSDICVSEGLGHYLNISDEAEHGQLKNAASRRHIPLHATLIACGFLDYAESVRSRRFLFPDLKTNPRGKLGGYFSNFFSHHLRRQIGIDDRRKVFHSFRHTFKESCRHAGIDEEVHDALTGHSNAGTGRKYGNEHYPLPPLFAAIQRLNFADVKLDHLRRPPAPALPAPHAMHRDGQAVHIENVVVGHLRMRVEIYLQAHA